MNKTKYAILSGLNVMGILFLFLFLIIPVFKYPLPAYNTLMSYTDRVFWITVLVLIIGLILNNQRINDKEYKEYKEYKDAKELLK